MTQFKKGTVVIVKDRRKGTYEGIVTKDFDTEGENDFYPIAVHQETPVRGMANDWMNGNEIPCRKGLAVLADKKEER